MQQNIVYVKAELQTVVTHKKVTLGEVAKLYGSNHTLIKELSQMIFTTMKKEGENKVFSILKVIETIHGFNPTIEVVNIGETDFLLSFQSTKKENKCLEMIKTVFVVLTAFFGAGFSIMSFNLDSSVSDIFTILYQSVLGNSQSTGMILEISYALGLSSGILVFYNHFLKKKREMDPTPIQVQMRMYEKDKNNARIVDASREGTNIDAD